MPPSLNTSIILHYLLHFFQLCIILSNIWEQVQNLENPEKSRIIDLAKKIINLTGLRSKIVFKPLSQDEPKRRRPDIILSREKLGWEPKPPVEEGLKKTIEYFEELLKKGKI